MRCIAHSLAILLTLGAATGSPTSASADDAPPKAEPNDSASVKDHVRRGQRAGKLDDDLSARRDWLQSEPSSSTSMCWQAPRSSPCGELARLQDARNTFGRAGLATVITGGVIGAVTAASFFTDFSFLRFKPAQDRVNVSPVANGNEIGARLEGVW
ncbi:hypothetical protein [Sorangium sp. So ce426]|uniref:hypothetical protein n=1 Tax=unclassified Sorangium TaxID=2621164 RepID=UPI003F5BDB4C